MNDPFDQSVTQFQKRYFEEFGEQISDAEALEKLTRLTNVVRVFLKCRPSPAPLDHDSTEVAPFDGLRESGNLKSP